MRLARGGVYVTAVPVRGCARDEPHADSANVAGLAERVEPDLSRRLRVPATPVRPTSGGSGQCAAGRARGGGQVHPRPLRGARPGVLRDLSCPFDPLGFAFENYDAVGAYRTVDGGKPVDATGTTVTPGGVTISFNNAIELTSKLAESDEVKWCVTKNWFRYMLGRPETDAEKGSMELAFRTASATPGYSLRDVILSAVRSMAFRFRTVSPGEGI